MIKLKFFDDHLASAVSSAANTDQARESGEEMCLIAALAEMLSITAQ